jgi:SAM-dependent methyltransferase
MGVTDKLRQLRWQAAGHYRRPVGSALYEPLRGARALEVGGPSALFRAGGLLPVYPVLAGCDGVQWAAETAWHDLDVATGYVPDGAPTGELRIVDGVDLTGLTDGGYDAILSSHVIEHFANPLRALAAWRRVLRPGGYVLLVAPHLEGTFDHRRSVTTLDHIIADRDAGTDESDLTHLEETLRLHDRARDADTADAEAWAAARRDNVNTRLLHHHTFDTLALLGLLDAADLDIRAVEVRFPHDIYALARVPEADDEGRVDNAAWLAPDAAWRAASPFRADRA